ncbi:MAG: cation transporter, partial [Hyphomicrobiaceae bacterium]
MNDRSHDGHGHHRAHAHGHHHSTGNEHAVGLAAVITGTFMVVEIVGGLLSGSLALLADAGHMLT